MDRHRAKERERVFRRWCMNVRDIQSDSLIFPFFTRFSFFFQKCFLYNKRKCIIVIWKATVWYHIYLYMYVYTWMMCWMAVSTRTDNTFQTQIIQRWIHTVTNTEEQVTSLCDEKYSSGANELTEINAMPAYFPNLRFY